MRSVTISSLIGVALMVGLLCFFFSGQPPVDYEVTDNYIYGIGVGKFPQQAPSESLAEAHAKQAAFDNARAGILKGARTEEIETSFVDKEEGTVKMPEIVETRISENKVVIKARVPIVIISDF